MKTVLNVVLLLFFISCNYQQIPKHWTVMSWNVQNLFDDIDDGNEYREFDPGSGQWTTRLYQRRLSLTGDVIKESFNGGPDFLVLQEIENSEVLNDLQNGPLESMNYRFAFTVPGFSLIRTGVLSRYSIREVRVVDCGNNGESSLRPALAMTIDTPGGPVRIITVHWKSQRGGKEATEKLRIQEALAVSELVNDSLSRYPGRPLMIIGDMNTDGDGTVTPSALRLWEPGITRDKSVLFRSPEKEVAGLYQGVYVFFDPNPDKQKGPDGTYWYNNKWQRLDRALLTPAFIDGSGLVFSEIQTGVGGLMGDSLGRPLRWNSSLEEGYSDHLPILLEFLVLRDRE